jgi:hypothetical protein
MQLQLKLDIPPLDQPITYKDKLLLTGSCFTEHISDRLTQHKFKTLANPHGILFNPLSVAKSLNSYAEGRAYDQSDLFYLNELWNSWDHHTRFSDIDKGKAVEHINSSQREASGWIKEADWVVITLGSAFQYYLKENNRPVANNHRAPAQWFERKLLTIDSIVVVLSQALKNILSINPGARFLFTVSPVRHIKDGVVENNRSKARLLEAVHLVCEQMERAHYFPSYELVIDILRDYRFYDIDFVHPNYLATQYVWEQFAQACIAPEDRKIMAEVKELAIARGHRSRFPETEAHKRFLESYKEKAVSLMKRYPYLDLNEEMAYFSN